MQLPTAFGKSYMNGMMAKYANKVLGLKVTVIVPNDVLAAVQQDLYCPWANRVYDDMWRTNINGIHYCTYDDFLTGKIPFDTLCLVDEIDSLFFNDKPEIKGAKFISAIILLNRYRFVGLTATFRGDQGKDKIL